jgi:thiol:disulfide interchange protein DsbA
MMDSILDEHQSGRLSQAEQQATAVHRDSCTRCAASWSAYEVLRSEDMGEPPAELFAQMRLADAAGRMRSRRRRAWAAFAAAAAVASGFAVRPWVAAPPDVAAGPVRDAARTLPAHAFVAGRDYEVLARPADPAAAGRIAVTEFFMYPCFHCYAFETEFESWVERTQGVVAVIRIPVVFSAQAELHARAFYAAEALGKGDVMHAAFYEEVHARANALSSRAALAEFFGRFGVDAATFAATFDSVAVDARVQQARNLARQFNVQAVPTLVVAGKYSTGPNLADRRTLEVVDALVGQEAAR